MLPTAPVVSAVVFDGGVVGAFSAGSVWARMGTIGVTATTETAARLLASGPAGAEDACKPVFDAVGRKTVWLGDAGQGSRMKIAINAYMSTMIEGVAEALELADHLGIDPAKLDEAIAGGPLDAPIAGAKLHKMERGDFAPEFPLEWRLST